VSEGEGGGRLSATVDGAALSEADARALWAEFSQYMEEHRGDTAGFAALKGWAGVAPTFQNGRAVLVAWTKGPPPAVVTNQGRPQGGGGGGGGGGRGGGGGAGQKPRPQPRGQAGGGGSRPQQGPSRKGKPKR